MESRSTIGDIGVPFTTDCDLDARLQQLQRRAQDARADAELRALDAEIPVSPIRRNFGPSRDVWAEPAATAAAQKAAEAAASRAAAAEAERQQRIAAAATAHEQAKAAAVAAEAARTEAELAAEAAAQQRRVERQAG